MNPISQHALGLTRRHFLRNCQMGIGGMALGSLLVSDSSAASRTSDNPLAPRKPHFPGKAKRVIYLHMAGSPPHLDLLDYKPELVRRTGQTPPRPTPRTSRVPCLLGLQRREERGRCGRASEGPASPDARESRRDGPGRPCRGRHVRDPRARGSVRSQRAARASIRPRRRSAPDRVRAA
ncbi:MAG: DUF1501 domain-containing protein [Planctomycetes bacterium]|nr:DUF1501 domain-containing protein [Planctomycetota bacterium]